MVPLRREESVASARAQPELHNSTIEFAIFKHFEEVPREIQLCVDVVVIMLAKNLGISLKMHVVSCCLVAFPTGW